MKKKICRIGFVFSFCSLLATSAFAALAPVESRSSHSATNRNQGTTVSEPISQHPVFVGTNQAASSSPNQTSSSSASIRNSKNTNPSAASGSGYPMTSQDRAAHLTLSQIENLQRELSELRGLVETQEHTIKQLKKSQQDLYLDLERRLNQLQNTGQRATSATSASAATPASTGKTSKANVNQGSATTTTGAQSQPALKPAKTAAVGMTASVAAGSAGMAKSAPKTAQAKTAQGVVAVNANPNLDAIDHDDINDKPAALEKRSQATAGNMALMGEKETYQHAYGFVRSKKYEEAIEGLQDYLNRFQKGEQAPQAHYWLGEVYMVQWHSDKSNLALLEKATTEFTNITTEYPNHPKTADALLKLGLIEIDKGNSDKAQQYLSEVKARYPGSAAARIAENRLQQLPAD